MWNGLEGAPTSNETPTCDPRCQPKWPYDPGSPMTRSPCDCWQLSDSRDHMTPSRHMILLVAYDLGGLLVPGGWMTPRGCVTLGRCRTLGSQQLSWQLEDLSSRVSGSAVGNGGLGLACHLEPEGWAHLELTDIRDFPEGAQREVAELEFCPLLSPPEMGWGRGGGEHSCQGGSWIRTLRTCVCVCVCMRVACLVWSRGSDLTGNQ